MFSFDKSDFQRFAVSSVGALAVSAACLFGAVGPAKAGTPITAAEWQKQVESKISAPGDDLAALDGASGVQKVTLAAEFTADGRFAGSRVAQSSGIKVLDFQARQIVRRIHYPALPAAYRGQPTTVTMRLYFGNDSAEVAEAIRHDPVQFAWSTNTGGADGKQLAR
ncbi:TonB family protein [Sphingomonas sp. MMS24-J13]|uniref:TonB family protein n=1 Tax=Sphingomonas sp. MMS24-J13 TaxID=3238686 RepID=UPI00384ACC0D